MGVSLHRGPVGEPAEGVHLQGAMRDREGGLLNWSISLCRSSVGVSRGGLLCWGSGRIWGAGLRGRAFLSVGAPLGSLVGCLSAGDLCKLWRWASISIGAPLGNLEGDSSTGDFEKMGVERSRNGASLCEEAHCGGPRGRASLLGTLEDMLKLRIRASLSIGAPLRPRGTWNQEGVLIYRRL
jgi:hypothetical protein